jgi:LPS export ABC transporter permease LptG/LPS export ABC transporter permease LptF
MGRIRLYIFREFLAPTLLGVGVYTFLFLLKILFDLAELAIRRQVGLPLLGQLLLLNMPRLLAMTIPMAILLGILAGMGRLSSEGEVTALRSCGFSYLQMLPAALALGLLGTLLVGYDAVALIPRAAYAQHRLSAEILLAGELGRNLKPRIFYREIPGVLLYADRVERDGTLGGVLLAQREEGSDVQRLTLARKARIEQDGRTGRVRFYLEDGETHVAAPRDAASYELSRFRQEILTQPPDPTLLQFAETLRGALPRNYRELATPVLAEKLRLPPGAAGAFSENRWAKAELELHRRFAIPVACLLFALLGFPLGVVTRRGGRSSGFALSLGVVLVYWLVLTGAANLVYGGAIRGWVGAWVPNALTLLLAVAVLWWLTRDRRLPAGLAARLRWLRLPRLRSRPPRDPRIRRRRRRGSVQGGFLAGRLDHYLIQQYARAFLLVLASFYLVYLLADLRSLLDDLSQHPGLTAGLVARYFGYAAPGMALSGMPLAALFAALLSLGILERSNEITAMKAAGVSLYRISAPVLGTAVVLCILHFFVADYILPPANTRAAELRALIRNSEPASTFGPRQWVFGKEHRLYNFTLYRQAADEYRGVAVYRLSADLTRLEERIEARSARYEGGAWFLQDGWARRFEGGTESFRTFQEERLLLPEGPDYFSRDVRPPRQMSFARLRLYIETLRQAGYEVQELQVALHEKVSTAAVPLVLVLLGLPYAFRAGRRGSLAGAGLALGLAIVYYVFLAAFRQLGAIGVLPPLLAAWSPDLLFGGVGIFQMLSLRT